MRRTSVEHLIDSARKEPGEFVPLTRLEPDVLASMELGVVSDVALVYMRVKLARSARGRVYWGFQRPNREQDTYYSTGYARAGAAATARRKEPSMDS